MLEHEQRLYKTFVEIINGYREEILEQKPNPVCNKIEHVQGIETEDKPAIPEPGVTEPNNKSEISSEFANTELELEPEVTTDTIQQEPEPSTKSTETPEQILVHVLEDLEPFVGTDMVTYSLHKEDLVTIPKQNADILEKNNKVKLIEPKI
jgi:DNA replication initiation complex subunit (GINS family)